MALQCISGEGYKRIEYGLKVGGVMQFVETMEGGADHRVGGPKRREHQSRVAGVISPAAASILESTVGSSQS